MRLPFAAVSSIALVAAGGPACDSPYTHYARLVDDEVDFGEVVADVPATESATVENLTGEEAHVYFLPPTPFSASMEDETGDAYVPIDLEEHIPLEAHGSAEIALTYTCEGGDEGDFTSSVFVVAGPSADGPWTATQEVGELRFRGTCVEP